MRVAVVGGTGLTGRHVSAALTAAGHEPVVLARSRGVDLLTGEGLDAALDGVDTTVDVTNIGTARAATAIEFFGTAGRRLLDSAERAGVQHHLALSIVGIDRVRFGYFAGKLRQEELVRNSEVPWTVLRSTQFHEFAVQTLAQTSGRVAPIPRMRCQPIAVREVAAHLVTLIGGKPQAMAPDLAGPREESLVDMTRRVVRAHGERRLILPIWLPNGMASGRLLPTGPGPRGTQTFTDWLADHHNPDGVPGGRTKAAPDQG